MIRPALLLCLAVIALLIPLQANAMLDIDISENRLEITTGFTGETLTIFGTSEIPNSDIIILVKGPQKDTAIYQKMKFFGLWLNGASVSFRDVPHYYQVASSKPITEITDFDTRARYQIGLDALSFASEEEKNTAKANRFSEALIQKMQLRGLYSLTPDAVRFINDRLFRTAIYLPANVPIGDYEVQAYLIHEGEVEDFATQKFRVKQGGVTGDVHDFAFDYPFLYGLTAIILALFSSFMAVLLLRRD
jgi:uncharacterized protein (TIGR02186 family)